MRSYSSLAEQPLFYEFSLFGCTPRVGAEQVDLSRDHVGTQSILAVGVSFREATEEASFVRAVSRRAGNRAGTSQGKGPVLVRQGGAVALSWGHRAFSHGGYRARATSWGCPVWVLDPCI